MMDNLAERVENRIGSLEGHVATLRTEQAAASRDQVHFVERFNRLDKDLRDLSTGFKQDMSEFKGEVSKELGLLRSYLVKAVFVLLASVVGVGGTVAGSLLLAGIRITFPESGQ